MSPCYARTARTRTPPLAKRFLSSVRQLIESVNDTLEGQPDLELRAAGTPTPASPYASPSAFLTMTAEVWREPRSRPGSVTHSLIAYDH